MNVVFRTDSSVSIGSGHVMRCLTFADELKLRGVEVMFVCREHSGHLISLIENKGYAVKRLPQAEGSYVVSPEDVYHALWLGVSWEQDAAETIAALGDVNPKWLIVDHYALDRRWEESLRFHTCKILVIDDLADRLHDCDLLLDQNFYDDMEDRYHGLIHDQCIKLLGPKYALLRPEFAAARKNLRKRDGQIRRVLVFFGGVDPTNETEKALKAVASITDRNFEVDVVVGGANPFRDRIQWICDSHENFHFHCQVNNMAALMAAADLAIGAGGTATWERCYLELPSISIINADNQLETTRSVATAGATVFLGYCNNVSINKLAAVLNSLLNDPLKVKKLGEKSFAIMSSDVTLASCRLADVIVGGDNAKA